MTNKKIDAMFLESMERAQAGREEAVLFLHERQVTGFVKIEHGRGVFRPADGTDLDGLPEYGGVLQLVETGKFEPITDFLACGDHAHFRFDRKC